MAGLNDFVLDTQEDKELFNKTAEVIANKLVQYDGRFTNGVSRHQIRKMYENVISIKRSNEPWEIKMPKVKMIRSQIAYAVARSIQSHKRDKIFYDNLKKFIDRGINQIETNNHFETFCSLFEAVYGFYYAMGGANTQ